MVVLFSERKNKYENEIIEILKKHGANYISDKIVSEANGIFTMISVHKKTELLLQKGIVVFLDDNKKFSEQKFPLGIIGICEEKNFSALESFKKSNIAVISCGVNAKNTITFSSINSNTLYITIQRAFIDIFGNKIEPCELPIKLTKTFTPFSVMAAASILLLSAIIPKEF